MSKQPQVRTDLAVEAKDMYVEEENQNKEIQNGIQTSERTEQDITVSYVDISDEAAGRLQKKAGSYVTIYADGVKKQDTKKQENAAKIVAGELERLIQKHRIPDEAVGLVVGLGNWNVTPDALGPMTLDKIVVTSHLFQLEHESVAKGYRSVAAVTPGVMGVTGMETGDIIVGVLEQFNPDFVIAVDALASRSIERINETIQLSDTGIHPGSGVGNKRMELSEESLGIPVFAIGVPTVVDAVTITSDTIDYLLKHFGKELREKDNPSKSLAPADFHFGEKKLTDDDLPDEEQRETFMGIVGKLSEEEKRALIDEVLTPTGYNMVVTPKEVDDYMKDMANLVASGINASLHETINVENAAFYTR